MLMEEMTLCMTYGNLEAAMTYWKAGRLEEWIQLFLRNDGNNLALADGLLLAERHYTGIVDFDLRLLEQVQSGAPEYLSKPNDIEYFFLVVERMKAGLSGWNPPPLVIELRSDGSFYVCDGRHRLEMYRQLGVQSAPAIVWATGAEGAEALRGFSTAETAPDGD